MCKTILTTISILVICSFANAGAIVVKSHYGISTIEKIFEVERNENNIEFFYEYGRNPREISVYSGNIKAMKEQKIETNVEKLKFLLVDGDGVLIIDQQKSYQPKHIYTLLNANELTKVSETGKGLMLKGLTVMDRQDIYKDMSDQAVEQRANNFGQ